LGLAGALACVVGAAVFILWARDNAPLLFMAAMFVVFGCVAYWGGHAFASLETGSFTTLPANVDVSTLDPIDRVQGEISNMRNDLLRSIPWICGGAAALITAIHLLPQKHSAGAGKSA
jgi:hypothetical protein